MDGPKKIQNTDAKGVAQDSFPLGKVGIPKYHGFESHEKPFP